MAELTKALLNKLPDVFGCRRIFDLECELEDALERVEELEGYGETVSTDFEKDCWRSMRRLLNLCGFDWRDVDSDGVTADRAEEFIAEHIKQLSRAALSKDTPDV